MLIWVILFYFANLLDVLTTYLGMKGKTKEEMTEKELNPVVSLFIHNRKATYTFKFALSTVIVVFVVLNPSLLFFLSLITIMLFLVSGGNAITKYLTSKGKMTFGTLLTKKLKLPKFIAYLLILAICLFVSLYIYGCLLLYGLV